MIFYLIQVDRRLNHFLVFSKISHYQLYVGQMSSRTKDSNRKQFAPKGTHVQWVHKYFFDQMRIFSGITEHGFEQMRQKFECRVDFITILLKAK
jgi:hypothetical protein